MFLHERFIILFQDGTFLFLFLFWYNSSFSYLHSKKQNLLCISLFDRSILYSKLTKVIFLSILKQKMLYMWDTTTNDKIPGIFFVIIKKKCKIAAREICWRVRNRFLKIRNVSFFIRKKKKKSTFSNIELLCFDYRNNKFSYEIKFIHA